MKKLLFLLLPFGVIAQIPKYYKGIEFNKENKDLEADLSELTTAKHTNLINYTPGVWNVLLEADLDPQDPNKVLLIYGYDDSLAQQYHRTRNKDLRNTGNCGSCIGRWEREHVFPKSLATPKLNDGTPSAGTDAHNLRAVDRQMNAYRSNIQYIDGKGNARKIGGGFYPGDEWIGDVARILMYMHLRYETQCNANDVIYNTTSTFNTGRKVPELLLKWNAMDPPSELELVRNEIISETQGNRNPIIDNPYLATLMWGGPEALNTWEGYLSTEIYDTNKKINVDVYPNPTTDFINIKTENFSKANLYNISGQLILTTQSQEINLHSLPSGIYVISVHLENGLIITKKIIKK